VRIAVYDLALSGVPAQMGAVVLQALMGEVRKLDRTSAIGMDEIRLLIAMEAERQLTGCDEDSCLSEIAEALGADVVLAGSIARVGEQTFFTLRRLEQAQAQVSAQFTRTLVAQNGEEVLAVLGAAVESLFPERTLRTGQTRGVDPAVAARLSPPPLDPWAFWTAASVAGAAAATTAVAGATLAVRYAQFDALRTAPEARGRDVLDAQADTASAQTLFGVASAASVLAGAGAAAVFFFVDWQGIRASLPPEER
jgi:hypothetical protein